MEALDYREKGGYAQQLVQLHPLEPGAPPVMALAYIGTEDNPNWGGAATIDELADTIARSVGPSGPNIDYVLNLAEAMRRIAPSHADPHLEQLEAAVLQRLPPAQAEAARQAAIVAVGLASLESALHHKTGQ